MTLTGWTEILLVLTLVLGVAWPLGAFMADVFDGRRSVLSPIVGPLERGFYRLSGVDPENEQDWLSYTFSMIVFAAGCFLTLYAIQRLQGVLPLNPLGRGAVAPDLAFNTAVSFITNANWQAYAGETTMSHFTQMAGLTTNNFLDTAVAMGLALGLTRAFTRQRLGDDRQFLGRYDPLDALRLAAALDPDRADFRRARRAPDVARVGRGDDARRRKANDRHWTGSEPGGDQAAWQQRRRLLQRQFGASVRESERLVEYDRVLGQLVLPVAFVFTFGRMMGDPRQGRGLLAAMAVIFVVGLAVLYRAEADGNPLLTEIGVDPSAAISKARNCVSVRPAPHCSPSRRQEPEPAPPMRPSTSLTPIGGLVPMFNLLMGCIAPGGVGTGLYGILLLAILSVFIAGLMVGRTPEYLGKKIEAREMKFAIVALLLTPALVLRFAAVSVSLKVALDSLGNAGPHGLSEILYAYASTASNNGSAFGGLSVNTPWFNTTTGIVMLLGRIAGVVPIMAIAGSLAHKKKVRPSAGTFPTHGPLFVVILLGVVLIVTLLQFFPSSRSGR